jgi:polysaccharide biosynthesis/export protein
MSTPFASAPLLLAALALLPACRSAGEFVWVDALPAAATRADAEYVVTVGDVLAVRVYNQEGMSGRVRVRADGKISLPFVNDVDAAGVTPTALARRLEAKFKDFINAPVVTVALEEPRPVQVSVLGEVVRPGVYRLEPGATGVLNALAQAGGVTSYAARDRIFVLRRASPAGTLTRVRMSYEALARAEGKAASFRMQDADVLVVE